MKNYQATRSKIKNFLTALKERFSKTEWREFEPNEFCKEFQVSFILPQILKKEGYIYQEYKDGICSIWLAHDIMSANEVTLHKKLRDYCNKSARKSALKKKKVKAKNVVQPKFNFNKKEKKSKIISVSVGLNFYNSIIDDCKKNGLNVSQWMFNKLGAGSNVTPIEITPNLNLESIKKPISLNAPKKRGRPVTKVTTKTSNNLVGEVYNIQSIQTNEVVNSKTIHSIESAETKIKSLETIMSLYNNGVINQQELENLKYGVLNK